MNEVKQSLLVLSTDMQIVKAAIVKLNSKQTSILQDKWIDAQEVMFALKISPRTLQKRRDDGTLSFTRIKGKILYKAGDIETILKQNYNAGNK